MGLEDSEPPIVYVRKVQSSLMLQVPVHIQGQSFNAIIDTAAEVTLLSDKVYHELQNKPTKIRRFILNGAGRDMQMTGHKLEPTAFNLGLFEFKDTIHVAPIQDKMLIGLDFLNRHNECQNKYFSWHVGT